MAEKKKSILNNIANAFTNKDEIAAAEKAAAAKAAAAKAAAKAASDRALAAEKASVAKAAASQAAANKEAAAKVAADRASAMKIAEAKAILAKNAAASAAAQPKAGTVNVKSLRVRKDHSVESPVVAGLSFGEKVSIVSVWTDGKNTWAQLGPDKWAAIKYDGEEMIKLG